MALREADGSAPAARRGNAAAAKAARVPHGRKTACVHGRITCAFVKRRFTRLRSAKHCFRNLSTAPDRLCRYSLPLAFYAENAALALRYPSHNYSATGRSCEKA